MVVMGCGFTGAKALLLRHRLRGSIRRENRAATPAPRENAWCRGYSVAACALMGAIDQIQAAASAGLVHSLPFMKASSGVWTMWLV